VSAVRLLIVASPRPKPVEQKIREGNPGQRRLPEPLLVAGRPNAGELDEPPEHLPATAKAFWRDTVARLVAVGLIDRVDVPMLEQLSVQYARIRAAQKVIAVQGMFTRGSVGQIREHPAVRIEREATRAFLALSQEFGITPVARTRLGLAELHRRTLKAEFDAALGEPDLKPVDAA
jgi:P27 family predicted phage terminase small subunit